MLRHNDFNRCELADPGVGDARGDGAVDNAGRQMPQEIDDARVRPLMTRGDEIVQDPLDLGTHPLQGADRGEQRG
jgi:hypothetical protein